jgi:hypothetical protein
MPLCGEIEGDVGCSEMYGSHDRLMLRHDQLDAIGRFEQDAPNALMLPQ